MARKLRRLLGVLIFLIALAMSAFVLLRGKFRPVIQSLAETQVKNVTSDLANDALAKQIAEGNIAYDRMVYFEKDLNGRITALKTNIGEINRMKTDVLSIRNSDAVFDSSFSQAGINQTLHRLNMQVSVDVSVLILGQTSSFTVNSGVVVAETVIVGEVPDTFLQTGGSHGSEKEN